MMNNKGSVLIFVLIFIAFAASTVLLIHERSTKSVEETSKDFYENQASLYATTALTAVIEAFQEDDNTYDSRRDDWAIIPVVEVPYGYISVDIIPMNAKFSINNMIDTDPATAADIWTHAITSHPNLRQIHWNAAKSKIT